MLTPKTTSIKEIIAKVYRDLQLKEEVMYYDIYDWCIEALEHIGVNLQSYDKTCCLDIDCFQAILPADLINLQMVRHRKSPLYELSGYQHTHTTYEGYIVNSPYIKTSFRSGRIELFYTAFPVDEDGFPLIPDDVSYKEALFRYVVMKMKFPDYLAGKIPQSVYTNICTKWEDYCSQAASKAMMPGLTQMESLKNSTIRLVPKLFEFNRFFKDLGNPQYNR